MAALLGQLSFIIRRHKQQEEDKEKLRDFVSFNENKILSKCTIGIVVPFQALVKKYEDVLTERLLHKFSLNNIQIGLPEEFYGVEKDIMIVSSFRNSVDQSLGGFTTDEGATSLTTGSEQCMFNVKLFKNILTRSKKFIWFVGSLETLESTNEKALIALSKFVRRSTGTYKKFVEQADWKKFKLTKRLFSHQISSGKRSDSKRKGEDNIGQSSSRQFHEERKNASSY